MVEPLCLLCALFWTAPPPAPLPEGATSAPAVETPEPDAAPAESEPQAKPFDIVNNDRLTGDWWGGRTWLEDRGIDFSISMTSIYQQNVHGGLRTHHGHDLTGSVDYELTFDLGAMKLLPGGTIYVLAEQSWNDSIGETRVGNLFDVNGDAAGDNSAVVSELWFEQKFWGDKARFRLGKIDVTTDVDTNRYANDETAQFLNPALINTGNIAAPDLGLGAQLIVQPLDWLYFGVLAADAQANGRETGFRTTFHDEDYFFSGAELGLLPVWNTPWGKLPGGYRWIVWYDPQPKAEFFNDLGGRRRTVPMKRDDVGFAFNMDQLVYKERRDDDADDQGLGFFFRYGWADEAVNVIEHFWSLGAQYQGLIPTRDHDVLGFGFAQGILSDQLRALEGGTRESVYELYYNAKIFPWLTVTPDLQYIVNPGAGDGRDAFVAGLRVQMAF